MITGKDKDKLNQLYDSMQQLRQENANLKNNYGRLEHDLYRRGRNAAKKNRAVGAKANAWHDKYFLIYLEQIRNILVTLIEYENAPITFSNQYHQYNLRNLGFSAIGGTDKDNIHVLSNVNGIVAPYYNAGGAVATKTKTVYDELTGKELKQITKFNIDTENFDSGAYIIVPNKFTSFNGFTDLTDWALAETYADDMATVKASELWNSLMLRTSYVGISRNGNLDAKNFMNQKENGNVFVEIDDDVHKNIEDLVQFQNLNENDNTESFRQSKASLMYELLTFLGINALENFKKERAITNEVDANNSFIEASGKVYLNPQNEQLELLNKVLGSDLKARYDLESLSNNGILTNEETETVISRTSAESEEDV
jgi:hypothetical protein